MTKVSINYMMNLLSKEHELIQKKEVSYFRALCEHVFPVILTFRIIKSKNNYVVLFLVVVLIFDSYT